MEAPRYRGTFRRSPTKCEATQASSPQNEQGITTVSCICFFFSSRRRHTSFDCAWSSDVCSSDLADILLPFEPLGLGLTFAAVEGPQITRPIREAAQVLDLPPVDPATDLGYVLEAVRLVVRALPAHVPLIGFAGAPFTLASYAIEGGGTRDFMLTKRFMYEIGRASCRERG